MRMGFELVVEPGAGADHIYLEMAAVVTTFLLGGPLLRDARQAPRGRRAAGPARARGQGGLGDRRPTAPSGACRSAELAVGDRFVVRPGERVATDGVVEEGTSAVDASLLTGESVPVEVGPGDEVAGATINAGGRLVVRATRVGAGHGPRADRAARDPGPVGQGAGAAARRPHLGRLRAGRDRRCRWRRSASGSANGAGPTFAFTAAVAVLIIACPCALGLATPTALLVGTGRGAQLGILIKGPEVLESTRRVDTIVLDKTGTSRPARWRWRTSRLAEGEDRAEVLRLVGALEDGSEHPIARAIARAARDELGALPAPEGFANREGLGVEGVVDGRAVVVGPPGAARRLGPRPRRRAGGGARGGRRAPGAPPSPRPGTAACARCSWCRHA